jgi:hypothetical protein
MVSLSVPYAIMVSGDRDILNGIAEGAVACTGTAQ